MRERGFEREIYLEPALRDWQVAPVMKLEREVSNGRGWEDIWLAAEREMAHWQVAPILKLELDSFKQHFQILNDFKLKSHQLDNCITHQNLQLSFLAFLRLSLF